MFTEQRSGPGPGLGDVGHIAAARPVYWGDSYIKQTVTAQSVHRGDEGSSSKMVRAGMGRHGQRGQGGGKPGKLRGSCGPRQDA